MADPNHPKNQHYVPQFLLRGFTNEKGQVVVFDKAAEKTFPTSPRGVAAEARFYDFVDGNGDPQSLEHFLGSMEAKVAGIIGGILDRESIIHLTRDDRVFVSLFAAVQQLRVKAERQRMQSLNAGILRVLAERRIDPGDVVREMNDDDVKRQAVARIHMAKKTAEFFVNKAWVLRRAPENRPFWISDNPVTLHNITEPNQRGLDSPGVEIQLPISRRFSICFLCDSMARLIRQGIADLKRYERDFGYPHPGAAEILHQAEVIETGKPDLLMPENVDHQNSLQVQYASRFIISAADDFGLAREMIRRNPRLKEPPRFTIQ
jgi:hypothetical protein